MHLSGSLAMGIIVVWLGMKYALTTAVSFSGADRTVRTLVDIFLSVILLLPLCFANAFTLLDLSGACFSEEVRPIETIYFSVVTYTTLGYGDITPVGPCRYFAAFEALLGLFALGLFVATVSTLQPLEE